MTPNRYRRLAASVVFTALAVSISQAAVTNVSIVSSQGVTNIVRNIITNNVGNGNLLQVVGTNIVGIATNSFAAEGGTVTNFTVINLNVSNFFATNIYSSNFYATNIFATNIYTTNLFATNIYNSNFYTTNVYSSNIFTTNLTVNNNNNTFKLNGKDVSFISVNGTNVAPFNLTNSATVTLGVSGTNVTMTASGGGGGGGASVWIPNTALTYSGGTNVTIDGSGGTNFFLLLTNTAFFVTPNNVPASKSTNTYFTVYFQQDSTGTRAVTWTNGSFKWPGNNQFQPTTNANAVSYVTFTMSPFTNGIFIGDYGVYDSR